MIVIFSYSQQRAQVSFFSGEDLFDAKYAIVVQWLQRTPCNTVNGTVWTCKQSRVARRQIFEILIHSLLGCGGLYTQ